MSGPAEHCHLRFFHWFLRFLLPLPAGFIAFLGVFTCLLFFFFFFLLFQIVFFFPLKKKGLQELACIAGNITGGYQQKDCTPKCHG